MSLGGLEFGILNIIGSFGNVWCVMWPRTVHLPLHAAHCHQASMQGLACLHPSVEAVV
jgi:hypothetical protein